MVKDDVVPLGRDGFAVFIHLRHPFGLGRAVNGGGGQAQHGNAHAEELDLTENEEGDHHGHQGVRQRHAA